MSQPPEDRPFHESDLESPVYRARLRRKLNCLIAVLEVSCAKVKRSLESPDADVERLERIARNLDQTLEVCRRARRALDRREALPADLPARLAQVGDTDRALYPPARRGRAVEMSSAGEQRRFAVLPPISRDELDSVDLDELARRLGGE